MSTPQHTGMEAVDSSNSHLSYCYRPLKSKQNFRLLRLIPAEGTSGESCKLRSPLCIQGTLVEHEFNDEDCLYDCLSYTWGSPERTHTCILDGKSFAITKNLDLALRSVRSSMETDLLWVDAICINQRDPEEQAQQVGRMRDIYSHARQVLAYLGEQENNSDRIPFLIRTIVMGAEKWASTYPINGEDLTRNIIKPANFDLLGLPSEDDPAWSCLTSFLSRPWFRRVWVIQEAVLAHSLTVVCGDWKMIGELVFQVVTMAIMHAFPLGQSTSVAAAHGISQINFMKDVTICLMSRDKSKRIGSDRSAELSILELIQNSKHENATNPRDNIFALLGLSKERTAPDLRPDYVESVPSTYRRFAKYLVKNGQGPLLLEQAYNPGSILRLPSWVPDWRNRHLPFSNLSLSNDIGLGRGGAYVNAGGRSASMQVEPGTMHLFARGYLVDQIDIVGYVRIARKGAYEGQSPTHSLVTNMPQLLTFEDLLECIEELSQMLDNRETRSSSETKEEILWRTLVCNKEMGSIREAPASYAGMLEALLGVLKMASCLKPENQHLFSRLSACLPHTRDVTTSIDDTGFQALYHQVENLFAYVISQCEGRRRGLTRKGHVCQIPEIAQRGDFICIIAGVRVPLTLRKMEGGYKLLGQCYLHGFMKGEILSMSEYHEQDIVIL